jgi:putative transposase
MSESKTFRQPAAERFSVLSDPPETRQEDPNLDDIMPDPLEANQRVFIDGRIAEFLYKHDHGPHEFLDPKARKQFPLHTAEIMQLKKLSLYIVPGGDSLTAPQVSRELEESERRYLQMSIGSVPRQPRSRAEAKFLYVGHFLSKILDAAAEGELFAKNEDNAALVVAEVDAIIAKRNEEEKDAANHILIPRWRAPRTVLAWVQVECEKKLGPVGQVHKNSTREHERVLPQAVFDIIAETIRTAIGFSGKFGPRKIFTLAWAKIKEQNDLIDAQNLSTGSKTPHIPYPSESIVREEYKRYDPWIRLAQNENVRAADLEFGAVGKLQRPKRINDLWELDHHLFDVHTVLGAAPWSQSSLPRILSRAGRDRFWICLAIDGCSGYVMGFCITFDPGGLGSTLECIQHAIEVKTYTAERWPELKGVLLGHGKPVRIRYDNAKAYVRFAMGAALARIGVGFAHSPRRRPDKKPYVERSFGTIERDFVSWLPGATGSNPREKGDRNPVKEAKIEMEDFVRLFHQYIIECFNRRPQEDLGWRTPEDVWLAGQERPNSRPRPLTVAETSQAHVITSIAFQAPITRLGIAWKGLHFNSPKLQKLRTPGVRIKKTPAKKFAARMPTAGCGVVYVAPPRAPGQDNDLPEIEVPCTNPYAKDINHWQLEVILGELRQKKQDPDNHADFRMAFLRLFRASLAASGVGAPGEPAPKSRLTNGQAPRFLGVFQNGPKVHALDRVSKIAERYDVFGEIAAIAAATRGNASEEEVIEQVEQRVSQWISDPIEDDIRPDDTAIR